MRATKFFLRTGWCVAARRMRGRRRGSVLVVVLVTLMFAAFALTVFIDKASTDLIVETREADAARLRLDAYSALEVTLAVLQDFRIASNGLRSPAEGWDDPLSFAGWSPREGVTVEIAFEDESAKISLPRANTTVLMALFRQWELSQMEAEKLTDALLQWMNKEHIPVTPLMPSYENSAIPFLPPVRPLRSFNELATIDHVREAFYDEHGRPNEMWHRFKQAVSLFDYRRPNLNSASTDVLAAVGGFDLMQQERLNEFRSGLGSYSSQGPGFFRTPAEAQSILGSQSNYAEFDSQIRALRIRLTVRHGESHFHLNVVVAPPGGAQTVQSTAITNPAATTGSTTTAPRAANQPTGRSGTTVERNLNYPFTVLEIRENDGALSVAPPPTPSA